MKKWKRTIKETLVYLGIYSASFVLMLSTNSCQAQNTENHTSTQPADKTQKKIKIALLLDTSNSMDGLINQAKSQLWSLVNELSKAECDGIKPQLHIALYQYGNQGLNAETGYIQQILGFTGELDEISAKLFALSTNGGDEYCGWVIQKSLDDLDWGTNESDLKFIFIAGNEAFTQGKVNFATSCLNAKTKGVVVNTIFCGNFQEGINTSWKSGADIALGQYMSIDHNQRTVYVATPYDNKIDSLNTRLNTTYIYYGNDGQTKFKQQEAQDLNAKSISQENKVERSITKGSSFYKNDSWDLVDKAGDSEIAEEVKKVDVKTLPAEMQKMTEEERISYVKAKADERAQIQKEINELSSKRQVYIASNTKTETINLNSVMSESIKKKAVEKNYTFTK